jgi:hypothetical protein
MEATDLIDEGAIKSALADLKIAAREVQTASEAAEGDLLAILVDLRASRLKTTFDLTAMEGKLRSLAGPVSAMTEPCARVSTAQARLGDLIVSAITAAAGERRLLEGREEETKARQQRAAQFAAEEKAAADLLERRRAGERLVPR